MSYLKSCSLSTCCPDWSSTGGKTGAGMTELKRTRVAVVGSSIGSLSTVYNVWKLIGYKCDIEIFEPSEKLGSSWRGQKIDGAPNEVGTPSVSGASQPEFFTFLREVGVKSIPANRSVYVNNGAHPFGCSNLSLWRSLLTAFMAGPSAAFKLLWSILVFFRAAWGFLNKDETVQSGISLREFVKKEKLSIDLVNGYLITLASVLRPVGSDQVLDLDAYTMLRALADNYLLTFTNITWTAFNGEELVDSVIEKCKPKVNLNTPVTKVRQLNSGKWCINDDTSEFDAVALNLDPSNVNITLETENADAKSLLEVAKGVQYEEEISYYHKDEAVMPSDTELWRTAHVKDGVTSFLENERNGLDMKTFFKTVVSKENASRVTVDKSKYLCDPVTTQRPCLSTHNQKAKARIQELSGSGGLYFSGSAYGVDNFEHDYTSGVRIANLHSNKAIPSVREPVSSAARPINGALDLIKYLYTVIAVKLLIWVNESRITEGCIGFLAPNHDIVYFGQEGVPAVVAQVKNVKFIAYAVIFGEFGWVEPVARKWMATNNVTLLAGYLCKNLAGKKNFLQRISTKYFTPEQFEFMATYEQIGDFFGCILDETKTFSVAMFDNEDESMEDAQYRKLDSLIERLTCIDKDSHVLEVGAGWGSFAVRLAKKVGCKVTCATTSPIEPIFELAKEHGVEDKVDAVLLDMLEISKHFGTANKFDACVMIEVVEETGDRKYDPYFQAMSESIKDGGQLVMQITFGKNDYKNTASDLVKEYGYPGDNLPSFDEVYHIGAKHGLVMSNCQRITGNYVYVGRNWMRNFLARSSVKGAVFSDLFKHHVKLYLQLVPCFATSNHIHTYQVTMDKVKYDPSPMY